MADYHHIKAATFVSLMKRRKLDHKMLNIFVFGSSSLLGYEMMLFLQLVPTNTAKTLLIPSALNLGLQLPA